MCCFGRCAETLDFFAFDVGMVTDVKERNIFVDYRDEDVHAVPLKASGWNCSTNDIQRRQHRWHMLAKKYTKTEAKHTSMGITASVLPPSHDRIEPAKNEFLVDFRIELTQ